MINGIEVLNTYTVEQPNLIGNIFTLFVGVVFAATVGDHIITKVTLAAAIISLVIVGTIGLDKITTYEVTISDEVSMTEFYEKYEVVDQKGKIFVIRERSGGKE